MRRDDSRRARNGYATNVSLEPWSLTCDPVVLVRRRTVSLRPSNHHEHPHIAAGAADEGNARVFPLDRLRRTAQRRAYAAGAT